MSYASSECCRELSLLLNKRPREPTLLSRRVNQAQRAEQARRTFHRRTVTLHTRGAEEESDVPKKVAVFCIEKMNYFFFEKKII